MATTYTKGKLYRLKIADLQPDPNQARKFMDPVAINELAASILKLGVMVPIQFRQDEQGALVIVSGHRRVTAAGKAGLTEIYGTFTDGDTRLQGFVDNLQREGLPPVDEAEQMAALMKEYVFNQYQLADALGKAQPDISKTMSLNKLPEDIRNACRTNPNIPKETLLEVAKMKTDTSMRRKFQVYINKADKAGQTSVQKPKLSKQRFLITKTEALTGALDGLPWSEWSEDDRNDLVNALTGIHNKTEELLNAINPQPAEAAPVNPGGPSPNLS
ncbi:MAG: ParB/RepB/Spo0J family partition protein [Deltaproteobacteria bacterium]|nr:MAG: ParB/RepB/Spo0J family partition protein [Deltaproteobacteria bacterium]